MCLHYLRIPTHVTMILGSDVDVSYIPASDEGLAAVGDTITYAFDITNMGSVTLSSIELLSPTVR